MNAKKKSCKKLNRGGHQSFTETIHKNKSKPLTPVPPQNKPLKGSRTNIKRRRILEQLKLKVSTQEKKLKARNFKLPEDRNNYLELSKYLKEATTHLSATKKRFNMSHKGPGKDLRSR